MKSLLLLFAAGVPALNASETTAKVDDTTGSIVGQITFEGERPEPKPALEMKEDATTGCVHSNGMDKQDRSLLISDKGGIANVVVMVEVKGEKPMVPSEPIVFDQKGCRFQPHVAVVPVGATLRFDNSDETNHNIHTFARKNDAVNKNISGGTNFEQMLDKAETIEIKCDIHPWMKGYIVVTDATKYAVTDAEGNFRLEGLPPGDYKVSYWHEELGKGKTEAVNVEAGAEAALMHKLGAGGKKKGGGRRRR